MTLLLCIATCVSSGCHRQFYRRQADCEAYTLLDEKATHVARPPEVALRIEPERRSRYFNPFDLDFQPRPLDDPASHRYMQCVDGRRGYPMWDAAGITNTVESPDWWQFLPIDESGVLTLNSENAVRIALLHSPEYQRQLEQLYLSALAVSSERFQFDTQFFGGLDSAFSFNGDRRDGPFGVGSDSFSLGAFSNRQRDLLMTRRFATGANLLVGVANNIVWDLSGSNAQNASTVLDFSLVQPLLRQGGRDVVLEDLTLAERQLLANIRSFERFRRSFFLQITIGRPLESRITTLGSGQPGGGIPSDLRVVGGFGGANGYLGLLQTQLEIRNLEENIARLTENVLILEDTLIELLTTIPDDVQNIVRQRLLIAQTRSSLVRSQTSLVIRQANYQAAIDAFLRDLGLPPYICSRIQDTTLDQFNLIEQRLLKRRAEVSALRTRVGAINVAILNNSTTELDPLTDLPVTKFKWSDDLADQLDRLLTEVEPLVKFNQELIDEELPRIRGDLTVLDEAIPRRRGDNRRMAEMVRENRDSMCSLLELAEIDDALFDSSELNGLGEELDATFEAVTGRLQQYTDRIERLRENIQELRDSDGEVTDRLLELYRQRTLALQLDLDAPTDSRSIAADESDPQDADNELAEAEAELPAPADGEDGASAGDGRDDALVLDREKDPNLGELLRDSIILESQDLLSEVADDVLALQLIQARARTESVVLPPVDIDAPDAFEIARRNRRDYANAKASLVDVWRNIEFVADDLESNLDFLVSGDVGNDGNNPFNLRSGNSNLRVGLQWDAPITRLLERNQYRSALIAFERSKRDFYQLEDAIWQVVRAEIRSLQASRLQFELSRQAVRIAAAQIELNNDIRILNDARGQGAGPTAARDAINALSDLLDAQNSLLGVFIGFEVTRRNLDFDLGTMELSPDGLWIDPEQFDTELLRGLPGTEVFPGNCNECCLPTYSAM